MVRHSYAYHTLLLRLLTAASTHMAIHSPSPNKKQPLYM
jgi:hypothetical protein